MQTEMEKRAVLLSDNWRAIRRYEPLSLSVVQMLCALLLQDGGQLFDAPRMAQCKALIRKSTPMFSPFQQNSLLTYATLLMMSEQPGMLLMRVIALCERLRVLGMHPSDHLTAAAFLLADLPDNADAAERLRDYYLHMKQSHPVLTNTDDCLYAAMLAVCCPHTDTGILRFEQQFSRLRETLLVATNEMQGLAAVLTAAGDDVPARASRLQQLLHIRRCSLDKTNGMPLIGVCAAATENTEHAAEVITGIHKLLPHRRGFGHFTVTAKERLIFAGGTAASLLTAHSSPPMRLICRAALIAVTTGTTVAVTAGTN